MNYECKGAESLQTVQKRQTSDPVHPFDDVFLRLRVHVRILCDGKAAGTAGKLVFVRPHSLDFGRGMLKGLHAGLQQRFYRWIHKHMDSYTEACAFVGTRMYGYAQLYMDIDA